MSRRDRAGKVYAEVPIQYRNALELVKHQSGKSIRTLVMEAIEHLLKQYGVMDSGDVSQSFPDHDCRRLWKWTFREKRLARSANAEQTMSNVKIGDVENE